MNKMEYVNSKELGTIEKELKTYDQKREDIISLSREIIKSSKIVINSLHRFDEKQAEKELSNIVLKKEKLDLQIKKTPALQSEGSAKVAYQEFAEAHMFFDFVHGKKITKKTLKISTHNYLLGLCDLTGELGRYAVLSATKKDMKTVKKISEALYSMMDFFLRLNLRNSELRKKSDAIKWNLKKTEDILYDLSKE